jgi:transcriptional regulator with XRE-family HTH domain
MRVISMGQSTETRHDSQGSAKSYGGLSGFTFKVIRESTGLTQVQLAHEHQVDVATVQGWESGRRPLAALRVRDLARLRARLLCHGATSAATRVLDDAIAADLIVSDAIQAGEELIDPQIHLLGSTAHQRRLTTLITWPFTGDTPAELASIANPARSRRGPVPSRPLLEADGQSRFFDHLIVTADSTHTNASLLRRQAIYLLGFDSRPSTVQWLREEQLSAMRMAAHGDDVASWVTVRSSAVALAAAGDPEPLEGFVRGALTTERQEQANLNYWAYWVGEIDTVHVDDQFMTRVNPRGWAGARLMAHLLDRLDPASPHLRLNIHTLWALLMTHPTLLANQVTLRARMIALAENLIDHEHLSPATRRELSDVTYAARAAQR